MDQMLRKRASAAARVGRGNVVHSSSTLRQNSASPSSSIAATPSAKNLRSILFSSAAECRS